MSGFVFHDPSGKRARRAGLASGLVVSGLIALLAAFAATLAFAPELPRVGFERPHILAALHPEYHRHKGEIGWRTPLKKPLFKPVPATAGKPLTVGFYVSWDEDSRASLQKHVDRLDVLAPQWIALTSARGDVAITADPQAQAILQNAKKRPAVVALAINARNAEWDGPMVERLLADPAARARLIANVRAAAEKNGWAGVGFDFENLSPRALALYPGFLKEARAALGADGRKVWVTMPFDDLDWDARKLQAAADQVVLMAYDEHWKTGEPGPVAGQGWYEQNLARLTRGLDPNRTIIALGSYGFDWTHGGGSEVQTFHEATLAAHDSGAEIGFDPQSLNPTFSYQEAGKRHEVWFLDAATLFNQIQVTDAWRPHGYAVWRLGQEDPGVWSVLGAKYDEATADNLSQLDAGEGVDFNGEGEVLRITGTPHPGRRTLTIDPRSELVSGERYEMIPAAYEVERYGFRDRREVALTFDDGPDGRWTPKILDILKQKHAPATFFVIGQNMQQRPDLVTRALREGHDVGGHSFTHPNIGQVPHAEVALELNATQRLFETLTGRSMRLFRPPFFGDADPSTTNEVAPLLTAQNLGYVNVGLRIDADDWQKPGVDQIVRNVLDRLDNPGNRPGQVVLLHDSGGDRSQTVAALPKLIDALRARGYTLVTVSRIAGITQAQAMPTADRSSWSLAVDRAAFWLVTNFEKGVRLLLAGAIVLGALRLAFLAAFSLVHRFRTAKATPPELDPAGGPLISVLIPCFNEEKVIVESVRRILASDWKHLEVLVLDDGSKDRTSEVVAEAWGDHPQVRLMRFENGGKALALNRGLLQARGDIVVALDADTLFAPETLGRLARWFADPKIGAVAGNALVGNRINLVTRWQALEYVTAQNLERRALAALGAVTVVPGAVGAWRRSALEALGGYPGDTLAEDQDLTLAVQRAGWKVTFDSEARAYTESPDTVGGLLKQRFRWSFGTLQCLWKHRRALFGRGAPVLGWVALPQVWLFQIVLTVIAPLVDLAVIWSLISAWMAAHSHPLEYDPDGLFRGLLYWSAFVLLDLAAGVLGLAMERRAPWSDLPWLPLQRFGYRQMMYYVVVKAVSTAINGRRVGWGKLERKATVATPEPVKAA